LSCNWDMLTFPSVGGKCISLLTPVAKLPRLSVHIIDVGQKARRTVRPTIIGLFIA
jgi:hypothetical protein